MKRPTQIACLEGALSLLQTLRRTHDLVATFHKEGRCQSGVCGKLLISDISVAFAVVVHTCMRIHVAFTRGRNVSKHASRCCLCASLHHVERVGMWILKLVVTRAKSWALRFRSIAGSGRSEKMAGRCMSFHVSSSPEPSTTSTSKSEKADAGRLACFLPISHTEHTVTRMTHVTKPRPTTRSGPVFEGAAFASASSVMSPDSVPGLGTTCLARVGVAGVMRPRAPFSAFCRAGQMGCDWPEAV